MNTSYDYLFKFLVVGDPEIGKSIFINLYTEGIPSTREELHEFKRRTVTVKTVTADGTSERLIIKNTISELKPIPIHWADPRYRGVTAFIVCFDVNNKDYLVTLKKWMENVNHYTSDTSLVFVVGLDATGKSNDFWKLRRSIRDEFGDVGKRYFQVPLDDPSTVENVFKDINKYCLKQLLNHGTTDSVDIKYDTAETTSSSSSSASETKYPVPKLLTNFLPQENERLAANLLGLYQAEEPSTGKISRVGAFFIDSRGDNITILLNTSDQFREMDPTKVAKLIEGGHYKMYDYDPHFSEGPTESTRVISLRDPACLGTSRY